MSVLQATIIHRKLINEIPQDLKPNNLLISSNGLLKIADFGLARDFADPGYKMTCQVITRYAPANGDPTQPDDILPCIVGIDHLNYCLDVGTIAQLSTFGLLGASSPNSCYGSRTCPGRVT